jgi:non-ribosomal peptide synthase protein (TIGR01720 family)
MNGAEWQQVNSGLVENNLFSYLDISKEAKSKQKNIIENKCSELQASHDLSSGQLLRCAYLNLGKKSGRLFISIHHLAVDGVSWRTLMEDFQLAYKQLSQTGSVQLPAKTSSFQQWAKTLEHYAESEEIKAELPFWILQSKKAVPKIRPDFPDGQNLKKFVRHVSVTLSQGETKDLLQTLPTVYHTQINEILLTALAKSYERWSGYRSLRIDLEGHGREEIGKGIDVSRTIGWFTSIYPVHLDLQNAVTPGEAIKTIKEQLRQVPKNGIGFGILRYLSQRPEIKSQLEHCGDAEIIFNYLGQFDQFDLDDSIFRAALEDKGIDHSLEQQRTNLIEINGGVTDNRLTMTFSFSTEVFRKESIQTFADYYLSELKALIAHCKSPEAGGYTSSDFKMAKLTQDKLDKVLSQLKKSDSLK